MGMALNEYGVEKAKSKTKWLSRTNANGYNETIGKSLAASRIVYGMNVLFRSDCESRKVEIKQNKVSSVVRS